MDNQVDTLGLSYAMLRNFAATSDLCERQMKNANTAPVSRDSRQDNPMADNGVRNMVVSTLLHSTRTEESNAICNERSMKNSALCSWAVAVGIALRIAGTTA